MNSPLSGRDRKQTAPARPPPADLRREQWRERLYPALRYVTRRRRRFTGRSAKLRAPAGGPMFRKSLAALSFVLSTGVASAGGSESQAGACSELDMRRAGEREPHGARADQPAIELTAVFLKSAHGYVGFVEELPGVN